MSDREIVYLVPGQTDTCQHIKVGDVHHYVFNYRQIAERVMAGKADGSIQGDRLPILKNYIDDSAGIPANLQQQAEKHSEKLTATLRRFKPVMRRHQAFGALDSSKLARLAAPGMSARQFDFEAQRAYKRREQAAAMKQVRIAVVGDFCFDVRSGNPEYAPMLSQLIHVITQACLIAGIPCAAYGVRGQLRAVPKGDDMMKLQKGHSNFAATAVLKDWDDEMNGPTFSLLNNEVAFMSAYLYGTRVGYGSASGNGGIDFARAQGADFVIAVGKFPFDKSPADVALPASIGISAAIDAIAGKLDIAAEGRDVEIYA